MAPSNHLAHYKSMCICTDFVHIHRMCEHQSYPRNPPAMPLRRLVFVTTISKLIGTLDLCRVMQSSTWINDNCIHFPKSCTEKVIRWASPPCEIYLHSFSSRPLYVLELWGLHPEHRLQAQPGYTQPSGRGRVCGPSQKKSNCIWQTHPFSVFHA